MTTGSERLEIAENELPQELEKLTLRRIAEAQIAGPNELGEFYEAYRKKSPSGPMVDLLFAFLETKQLSHEARDEMAHRLMPTEERLIRCDLADTIDLRRILVRDLRTHTRMIDRCGAVLLAAGESRLMIGGFNPTGLVKLRRWLGSCPMTSRALPYVSAMWLASEVFCRLSLARHGGS